MFRSTRFQLGAVLLLSTTLAPAATLFNSGAPDQRDGANMTSFVVANNFALAQDSTLTGVSFFSSALSDPFQDQFSGTVGYAIFADNGGTPGTLLFSGSDTAPTLTDTGNVILGTEEWRIDFVLPSLNLTVGTYFLGLHEGAWGAADDGTPIYWDTTSGLSGALPQLTADLTGAGGWQATGITTDLSFVISGDPNLPGVPEPATIGLMVAGLSGLAFVRRLKKS